MKKSTLISKGFLGTTCVASILGYGLAGNAAVLNPVTLELALLIDASESISEEHFYDQIDALNNIFNDPNFYNQYVLPLRGREVQSHRNRNETIVIDDPSVAVSIFQFGSEINPSDGTAGDPIFEQIVDWTVFNEQHQSGIGQLNSSNVDKVGGLTPIGDILSLMVDELSNNAYDGDMVVNLSSDGFETYSTANLSRVTMDAFRSRVTFNALVVPATLDGSRETALHNSDDLYNLSTLQTIVDRFGDKVSPERKNNNLTGNPAFIMLDYATGEKTLEEAFRLKLGLETIGTAPDPIEPPTTDPQGDPEADPEADPEKVPEPSSLLGLLMISVLGLLRYHKKA